VGGRSRETEAWSHQGPVVDLRAPDPRCGPCGEHRVVGGERILNRGVRSASGPDCCNAPAVSIADVQTSWQSKYGVDTRPANLVGERPQVGPDGAAGPGRVATTAPRLRRVGGTSGGEQWRRPLPSHPKSRTRSSDHPLKGPVPGNRLARALCVVPCLGRALAFFAGVAGCWIANFLPYNQKAMQNSLCS